MVMPKFKMNFHSKSMSAGSSTSPNTPEHDSSHAKLEDGNIRKECLSSIRSNRIFNFRKGFGLKCGNTVSISETGNSRTPLTSLFSSKQTRTLKTRHHRQYAVSLSQFLQTRSDPEADVVNINQMLLPATDPESPLERAQRRRLNNAAVTRTPITSALSPSCAQDYTATKTNIIRRSESFDSGISNPSIRIHSDMEICSDSRRHSESFIIKSAGSVCSVDGNDKKPLCDLGRTKVGEDTHELYRVAEIIQKATREICADQKYSQGSIFRSMVPITIFVYLFGLAIVIPRQISKAGITTSLWVIAFAGLILSLSALRASIWTVGAIAQAFCDADLKDLLRKSGMPTTSGERVGEADLVVGIFA